MAAPAAADRPCSAMAASARLRRRLATVVNLARRSSHPARPDSTRQSIIDKGASCLTSTATDANPRRRHGRAGSCCSPVSAWRPAAAPRAARLRAPRGAPRRRTSASTARRAPDGPNAGRFAAMRECLQKNGITLPKRTPGQRPVRRRLSRRRRWQRRRRPQLPKGVTRAQYEAAVKKCGGALAPSAARRRPLQQPRLPGGAREVRDLHARKRRERPRPEHLGQRPDLQHQRPEHEQPAVQGRRGQVPERPERGVPAWTRHGQPWRRSSAPSGGSRRRLLQPGSG